MTSSALHPSHAPAAVPLVAEDAPQVPVPAACTNCGAARAAAFCAECGQRAVEGRLTVPSIAQQVANDVLNLDRGLLFTALELTRRPGDAIRDYVDGKRVRYTGPVKYFVLSVALTTFATTQLGVLDEVATGMFDGMGGDEPMTIQQASAVMSQWMTPFMALGVPFTAAATRRLFRRAGKTYAEHLALNLYAYGHQCLALVLVLAMGGLFAAWEDPLVVAWVVGGGAYFAWTCTRFFRMRARRAVPLAVLGVLIGSAVYLSVAALIIGGAIAVATAAF